ncbi:hypothetical protein [Glycomyces buryatensis]|uniref:Uncharacterized protein n=1 Tax=Glycomyces buryatensis TaxID=2570927 RepID=A0A4S8Q8C1_9ACTN|nr:hypothetical protein [Glycomyces buryatensis]THV40633.1 hypothetical protein FAB82_15340 [Glycomyces buryatensis]
MTDNEAHRPRIVRVYRTAGGSAYHRTDECAWLHKGQRRAAQQGKNLHDIQQVHREAAEDKGLAPCEHCYAE